MEYTYSSKDVVIMNKDQISLIKERSGYFNDLFSKLDENDEHIIPLDSAPFPREMFELSLMILLDIEIDDIDIMYEFSEYIIAISKWLSSRHLLKIYGEIFYFDSEDIDPTLKLWFAVASHPNLFEKMKQSKIRVSHKIQDDDGRMVNTYTDFGYGYILPNIDFLTENYRGKIESVHTEDYFFGELFGEYLRTGDSYLLPLIEGIGGIIENKIIYLSKVDLKGYDFVIKKPDEIIEKLVYGYKSYMISHSNDDRYKIPSSLILDIRGDHVFRAEYRESEISEEGKIEVFRDLIIETILDFFEFTPKEGNKVNFDIYFHKFNDTINVSPNFIPSDEGE